MMSDVESRTFEVESDCRRNVLCEIALLIDWKLSRERAHRSVAEGVDHGNQISSETVEQLRQILRRHARLIILEQRVVTVSIVPGGICFLAREHKYSIEPRGNRLEIVFSFRVGPYLRCERRHAGHLFH